MREQVMRTTKRLRVRRVALIACALAGAWLQVPAAQVGVQGRWDTVPALVTINPVHMALMNNGKVLIVAGSGNVAAETNFRAAVWDPAAGHVRRRQPLAWDMFCNGMVDAARRPGVHQRRQPAVRPVSRASRGTRCTTRRPASSPTSRTWRTGAGIRRSTTLGDGSVMTFSGLRETGGTNTTVEIYTPGSGWSQEYPAGWTPPLYPRMHLMHGRPGLLRRLGPKLADLQPVDEHLVGDRRDDATTAARGPTARRCCCR